MQITYLANPVQTGLDRRITRLAFRMRFTFAEQCAIEAAADTDVQVRVVVKNQDAATYIDLSDDVVAAGLDLLVSKSLLTPARATQILTADIQPHERP